MNDIPGRRSAITTALTLLELAAVLFLGGCTGAFGPDDLRIRIANVSTLDMESVEVTFPDDLVDYGGIAAGSRSDYRTIRRAYGTARIEVEVEGVTLILQPIDHVGDPLLTAGSYTYELGVAEDGDHLTFRLRDDGN